MLVPPVLAGQWQDEIRTKAPGLACVEWAHYQAGGCRPIPCDRAGPSQAQPTSASKRRPKAAQADPATKSRPKSSLTIAQSKETEMFRV